MQQSSNTMDSQRRPARNSEANLLLNIYSSLFLLDLKHTLDRPPLATLEYLTITILIMEPLPFDCVKNISGKPAPVVKTETHFFQHPINFTGFGFRAAQAISRLFSTNYWQWNRFHIVEMNLNKKTNFSTKIFLRVVSK